MPVNHYLPTSQYLGSFPGLANNQSHSPHPPLCPRGTPKPYEPSSPCFPAPAAPNPPYNNDNEIAQLLKWRVADSDRNAKELLIAEEVSAVAMAAKAAARKEKGPACNAKRKARAKAAVETAVAAATKEKHEATLEATLEATAKATVATAEATATKAAVEKTAMVVRKRSSSASGARTLLHGGLTLGRLSWRGGCYRTQIDRHYDYHAGQG